MPYKDPVKAKDTARVRSARHYEKNKTAVLARQKEAYDENPARKLASNKRWQEENRPRMREIQKDHYDRNSATICERKRELYEPDKKYARKLIREYGIDIAEYERLFEKQKGRCKLCRGSFKKLCVDHCHDTGKVRGLLCRKCNTGIGMLGDNADVCERAAKYLRR